MKISTLKRTICKKQTNKQQVNKKVKTSKNVIHAISMRQR